MDAESPATDDTSRFVQQALQGDAEALRTLFDRYRPRLLRMIRLRMSRRLQGRIDPADVLQEAFLDAWRGLDGYADRSPLPFFLWLRLITGRKLLALHRAHLGAQARDAGREISLHHGALPEATSESMAAQLLGRLTSASQVAIRAELQVRLQEVLNGMNPIDREVLALRHFEQLGNAEVAQVLGIQESAASNRYVRALHRIRAILRTMPGFFE